MASFFLMAITLLPVSKAGADLSSSFLENPDFSLQDTLIKLMDPDETSSYPLKWEKEAESSYLKAENFYLNEEDDHLLLAGNPDTTEAGSICNEQRCYPYNPFRETVLTVEHLQNINMCKQTLELPVCKKLGEQNPEDLKNCEDPSDLNASSTSVSGTYVMGCMLGVKSFAEGMWEFAKMVGRGAAGAMKMPFSPSAREKWQRDYNAKFVPAKEKFIAFVKQAFRKEYNKHRKNFPRGSVGDMGASIQVAHLYFPKLWEKVMGVVEEQTEKLQCMNEGAKMRVGCMVLAEVGFEVVPAALTGGGTLALAMVTKAKKSERLVEVLEVTHPEKALSKTHLADRETSLSTVQNPKSNVLTKGLAKVKRSPLLPTRFKAKVRDLSTISQDDLFAIINTPALLKRLNAEQLQSIPDHLILTRMNFSMKRRLAGQMFRQDLNSRGKLVLYRGSFNSWSLNAMKEFINTPIRTKADLDSFLQRWSNINLKLYDDEGFGNVNLEIITNPDGTITFPPEFKQAFVEAAAKQGLLPNATKPVIKNPGLLIE